MHPRSSRWNAAILVLRVAAGVVFLYHGSAILFGLFGGPGPKRFAASLHLPVFVGYLVGIAQFCGALAIFSGILFRLGAVCLIIVMLGAIFLVHLPHGFSIGKNGIEYAFTQLLVCIALLLSGPGDWAMQLGSKRRD